MMANGVKIIHVLRELFGKTVDENRLKELASNGNLPKIFMAVRLGWISCNKNAMLRLIDLPTLKKGEEDFRICSVSVKLMELAKENNYILDDSIILNDKKLKGEEFAKLNNCVILLNGHGLIQYNGNIFNGYVPEDGISKKVADMARIAREYVKTYSGSGQKPGHKWFKENAPELLNVPA